ncbi:nSTAND1 domain-containing NTPase, partial [Lichenifustis flavocetrariae]
MLKDLGILVYEIAEVNDILGVFNSRLARLASASSGAPRWSGSPYKGLEPFGTADSPVFFGRGPERQEALARLRQAAAQGTAFLLLHGSSGVGKSSLARAGLLADIRTQTSDADHWRTAVLA